MIILIGILFSIALTALIGLSVGGLYVFLDLVSFLIVALPVTFFLLITKGGRILGEYFKLSFMKNSEYSEAQLRGIAGAAKSTMKIALASGFFGFLSGLMMTLYFVDLGGIASAAVFNVNLSVSLITLYYSIALAFFVLYPLEAWAENKLVAEEA